MRDGVCIPVQFLSRMISYIKSSSYWSYVSSYNTLEQVPDPLMEAYQDKIRELVSDGPVQNHNINTIITDERHDVLEERLGECEEIYVEDASSGFSTHNEDGEGEPLNNPVDFLRYRQTPGEVASEIYHIDDRSGHPVFEFEAPGSNYDEHFLYLSIHPENMQESAFGPQDGATPEIDFNGISIDSDENIACFGTIPYNEVV